MNFKKKIAKILSRPIQGIRSKPINKNWAYKLSIRQVALIFESKDLSCFGLFFQLKKFNEFMNEYNTLFNDSSTDNIDIELFRQKLYTKHLKLNAMYISLMYCDGENAKHEYEEMFGEKYDASKIERLVKKNDLLIEKLNLLKPIDNKKGKGLSFVKLIAIVETSRDTSIDRGMKLFEFKEIYDIELKKWQT